MRRRKDGEGARAERVAWEGGFIGSDLSGQEEIEEVSSEKEEPRSVMAREEREREVIAATDSTIICSHPYL